MAANPPVPGKGIISSQLAEDRVEIPSDWRLRQFGLIGLIAIVAVWFGLMGYHSPQPDSGVADSLSPFDFIGFASLVALVWFTTPVTWTIAKTTFHEAIRRRWVTALLGFAVVMLGVSTFFTWMQPGSQQKFLRDYGLGFTVIMTLIAAIFLGVALIPPEIERRTVFTILSKPVTRLEFLLGKYVGLLIVLAFNLLVMSAIFLLAYAIFIIGKDGAPALGDGGFFSKLPHLGEAIRLASRADNSGASLNGMWFDLGNLAKALLLQFGTLTIMAALAIMVSQFLSNIVAIIVSFVVYFLGQSAPYWEHLAGGSTSDARPLLNPTLATFVNAVYFVLPRLDRFDVRERIVNDLPVNWNYMMKASSSGCIYAAVLLTIAYFAWRDREF